MGGQFAFDDSSIREAAAQVGGAFTASTRFTPCGDCGSSLVADTISLFTDQLAQALKAAKRSASKTSMSMTACVDDFNQVETANVQSSRHLM